MVYRGGVAGQMSRMGGAEREVPAIACRLPSSPLTRVRGCMNRLTGKIAIITGAGSGIGRAAAQAFAAEGATVGLLDSNAEAVSELALELGERGFPLTADVSDEVSVAAAFAEAWRRHRRLDVLYTCAAIQLIGQDTRGHELDLATWERTLAVNLTGAFLCCKHGIRLMMEGGYGGSIITCGSPTALTMSGAGFTAYSSSKGGMMSLTRILAADYAKDGIRVNGIVPGTIRTPLTEALVADPATHAELVAGEPIGRLGVPEDLIGIAVFLASDESNFATGAHFHVDGGLTVR